MSYHTGVILRSEDRIIPSSSSSNESNNCDIRLKYSLEGEYECDYIIIPNNTYNVDSHNNQFQAVSTVSGAITTITLTPGAYTGSTLATELETQLDANTGDTHTVTFSSTTNKLSIDTASGTTTLTFDPTNGDNANRTLGVRYNPSGTETAAFTTANEAFTFPIFLAQPLSLGVQISGTDNKRFMTGRQEGVQEISAQDAPTNTTNKVSQKQGSFGQGELIAPFLSGTGEFTFISSDDFKQHVAFNQPSRTVNVKIVFPGSGELVNLNQGDWEIHLSKKKPLKGKHSGKRYKPY